MTTYNFEDSELVHAYGGVHITLNYEQAIDTCNWFEENDDAHGKVGLARIAEDCFELVAFGDSAELGAIGVDSDYVSITVGRRLAAEGRVEVMCLYGNPEDEPKTEADFARIRRDMLRA